MKVYRFGKEISNNPAAMALCAMQKKLYDESMTLRGEERKAKGRQARALDNDICLAVHGFSQDLYPMWYKLQETKKSLDYHLRCAQTLQEEIAEMEKIFE